MKLYDLIQIYYLFFARVIQKNIIDYISYKYRPLLHFAPGPRKLFDTALAGTVATSHTSRALSRAAHHGHASPTPNAYMRNTQAIANSKLIRQDERHVQRR
jgi:hypothetical protein